MRVDWKLKKWTWGSGDFLVGLLLGILAVAVRLVFLADSADDPSFMIPLVDSWTYHDLAAGLADGGVFNEKFLWQAVFYPAFLAGVYSVFGVSVHAAVLAQVFLAGITCFLTHHLGFRLFGRGPALAAGLIFAFYGPLVFFETRLLAVGWAAFFTVAVGLILVGIDRTPSLWRFAALGLVGAAGILTRPTFLPVIAVVGLWLAFHQGRESGFWPGSVKVIGMTLAGLLVVLGPVGLGLKNLTGHSGIVPPSGGVNLFIGNNADYEGTINIRPGIPWDVLMSEPVRHGYEPGPWKGQPYFVGRVMTFGRENPRAQIALWGKKTLQLVSSRELPRNLDVYLHRQWSGVLGALVFKVGSWGFPWGLVFPLAVVGLAVSGRRIPASFLILLVMLGAALVLVFISSRYRSPILPLMAVLAGQGLVGGIEAVRNGNRSSVRKLSSLLVAGILVTTIPGPFAQETIGMEGELYFGVGHHHYRQDDWQTAAENLKMSVALAPRQAAPRNFLGISLARMGDWEAACAQFDTALAIDPTYGEARRNLERCRRGAGRP